MVDYVAVWIIIDLHVCCYLPMFKQKAGEGNSLPGRTPVPRLPAERRRTVLNYSQGSEQVDDRRISRQPTEAV